MCRITHVAIENLMRLYVYGKCLVVFIYVSRSVSNSANDIIAIRSKTYIYMNIIKKMDPGKIYSVTHYTEHYTLGIFNILAYYVHFTCTFILLIIRHAFSLSAFP